MREGRGSRKRGFGFAVHRCSANDPPAAGPGPEELPDLDADLEEDVVAETPAVSPETNVAAPEIEGAAAEAAAAVNETEKEAAPEAATDECPAPEA
jgi:hypothetical protein